MSDVVGELKEVALVCCRGGMCCGSWVAGKLFITSGMDFGPKGGGPEARCE